MTFVITEGFGSDFEMVLIDKKKIRIKFDNKIQKYVTKRLFSFSWVMYSTCASFNLLEFVSPSFPLTMANHNTLIVMIHENPKHIHVACLYSWFYMLHIEWLWGVGVGPRWEWEIMHSCIGYKVFVLGGVAMLSLSLSLTYIYINMYLCMYVMHQQWPVSIDADQPDLWQACEIGQLQLYSGSSCPSE